MIYMMIQRYTLLELPKMPTSKCLPSLAKYQFAKNQAKWTRQEKETQQYEFFPVDERWTAWLHLIRRLIDVQLSDQPDSTLWTLAKMGFLR